jgi:hypothetical protein
MLLASPAHADACSVAINRFNTAANNSNFQYVAKFRQLFGREPSAATGFQLPQECRQTLEILRWRRGAQQAVVQLERAYQSVCRSTYATPGAAPASISANMSASQLLAAIESDLAANTAACRQPRVPTPTVTATPPIVGAPSPVRTDAPKTPAPRTGRTTSPKAGTPPTVTVNPPTVPTPTVRDY